MAESNSERPPGSDVPIANVEPPKKVKKFIELDGAQDLDVYFRPHRYSVEELAPLVTHLQVEVDGELRECPLHSVSQSGVSFVWEGPAPEQGDLLQRVIVRFDEAVVFDGPADVRSLRDVEGQSVVGAELSQLLDMDEVLHARTVACWRAGEGSRLAPGGWYTSAHTEFKALAAELGLYLEDCEQRFDEFERELPFGAVHGDRSSLAHQSLMSFIRSEFLPVIDRYDRDLDAARRLATPEEDRRLKAFSVRQVDRFLMRAPWMWRAFAKPFGYPGDYMIMDFFYEKDFAGKTLYDKVISHCFQQTPAARAVVCRKNMMKGQLLRLVREWDGSFPTIRILSIAAGPAQEMLEFLAELPDDVPAPVEVVLFDQDSGALSYAYGRIRALLRQRWGGAGPVRVTYLHDSIKRLLFSRDIFEAFEPFDMVISSGLYDYLKFNIAVQVSSSLFNNVRRGGRLLIGNMVPSNPSRWLMEHHLDWWLIYRTRDEMCEFARKAAPGAEVSIITEETGVNPFVVIHRT